MPTPFSLYRRANSLQGPKLQFTSSVLIIHSTNQKLMNFRFLREKLWIVKRSCKNNWGSQDRILLNRKFLLSTLDWILGHFSLVPKNDKNYENFWSSVKTHFWPSDQKFDLVPNKLLNFPVPVFGNGNGRQKVFIPNFETRNLFSLICSQQRFGKPRTFLILHLSVSPSISPSVRQSIGPFLSFLSFPSILSFLFFRFFLFFCFFFLFSSRISLIFRNSFIFSSSRNSRWERELFLIPENTCREVFGNCFSEIFGNWRDMTEKLWCLVPKHTFDLVKFDLVVVSHKNVGTILCLAYIDEDLCNSITFQYTVEAAWCDHFWLGYIW